MKYKIIPVLIIVLFLSCFGFSKYSGTDKGKDTPLKWGYKYKNTGFFTEDSVYIKAWEIIQNKKNPWIIIVPGFEDNKSDDKVRITFKKLAVDKYNFLLIDTRGFGESLGVPSFGILEKYDILSAVKHIRRKFNSKIGVIGFSQGASASILAASVSKDINALVVWAPYSDFKKEIAFFLKWRFAGSKNKVIQWARKNPAEVGNIYERYYRVKLSDNKPEKEIQKIKYRIILGHGINDNLIPFINAQDLLKTNADIFFIKSSGGHSFYGINIDERNYFLDESAIYFRKMFL
jgi:alpha/beta superfamily hydrolase